MGRAVAFSSAIILACCLTIPPALAGTEGPARVAVAKVNGKVLYMDQLGPILKAQQKQTPHRGPARPEPEKAVQRRAVEQLIDVELIAEQARLLEVPGLDAKVDERLAGLRQARPALINEKSEAEIRALVADEFRVDAYLRKQGVAEPEVPEADIRAAYDQGKESFRREETVHLRHISIQFAADATAEQKAAARAALQRAREQVLAGTPFETAAAAGGPDAFQGDLGLLTRSDMPEAIATAAFALTPGKLSDIIATSSGVHLVEVLERKPAGIVPYEEMRDFLRKYLQEGRRQQVYQQLVQGLRQKAKIEILL